MVKPSDFFLYSGKISSLSNMSTLILNSHETHNKDFLVVYVFIEHTALFLNISYQHPNRLLVLEPVQTAPILILFIPQFSMLLLHQMFYHVILDINKQTRVLFMQCHFGKMF